jgi:predicted DsbA family dithiol-disulfide isomerase
MRIGSSAGREATVATCRTGRRQLFQLYFERGENVGDHDGSGRARPRPAWTGPWSTSLRRNADSEAVARGSRDGVAHGHHRRALLSVGGKYAVMGAQDAATLATAIKDIATKAAA